MAKEPWRSIDSAQGGAAARVTLNVLEARESPCHTCSGAPCCSFLPLFEFRVEHMRQLDHAVYLLNFDRIELGLSPSGNWSVYYRYPCRFLNRENFLCRLHGEPEQPRICVHYNPYSCWYKKALTTPASEEFLRIDRNRMAHIVSRVKFDDARNLIEVPAWDALVEELPRIAADPNFEDDAVVGVDPVFDSWKDEVLRPPAEPAKQRLRVWSEMGDPCDGCGAWCCTTLVFPHAPPAAYGNLDYLKFALGFPGIEVGISDETWSLIVKTRCRHLDGTVCALYGQRERPLLCKYYDASRCHYKPQFGVPRPEGYLRVRLEQFPALAAGFAFDDTGLVRRAPSMREIRSRIEDGWRGAPPAAAPERPAGSGSEVVG